MLQWAMTTRLSGLRLDLGWGLLEGACQYQGRRHTNHRGDVVALAGGPAHAAHVRRPTHVEQLLRIHPLDLRDEERLVENVELCHSRQGVETGFPTAKSIGEGATGASPIAMGLAMLTVVPPTILTGQM